MMRMLLTAGVCCWAIQVSAADLDAADNEPVQRDWDIEGLKREALIYAPDQATTEPTPVVFAFHGHGGGMRQASNSFGIHRIWPEAIVVYMQGVPTAGKLTDPDGKRNGWQHNAGDYGDRDLKFFDAVLATLKKDYKVDERRIYSTGHSNGGGMTYLLWATRGDVFAAIGPSGAVVKRGVTLKPLPVLHVAGETDELVKYTWQSMGIDRIREINGCDKEGKPWAESGPIVGTLYTSSGGTPLVTCIYPGGHKFPPEAPALVVRFFKEHTKAE